MRTALILFVPWLFLLCSCGDEEIEFKPGPIMSDIIKNRKKEKVENKETREKTKELENQTQKIKKDIDPIVSREKLALSRQESLDLLIANAGKLSDSEEREALEVQLYEMPIKDELTQTVILVKGKLITLEKLKEAIRQNSTFLYEEATKDDDRQLKFEASPLNPETGDLPVVLSATRIELEEGERIESLGRDLWLLCEQFVYEGEISLKPPKADFEIPGQHAGHFYLYAIRVDVGEHALLDRSGGDAGDFNIDVPFASREQLQALHQQAINMAYDFEEIELVEVTKDNSHAKSALQKHWPSIRRNLAKSLDSSDDLALKWEDQRISGTEENGYVDVQVFLSGTRAEQNGRYPVVRIPTLEFQSDLPGGKSGEVSLNYLQANWIDLSDVFGEGLTTPLQGFSRAAYQIKDRDKFASAFKKLQIYLQIEYFRPAYRAELYGSAGSREMAHIFDGFKIIASASKAVFHTYEVSTWFEILSDISVPPQKVPAQQIESQRAIRNMRIIALKELLTKQTLKALTLLDGDEN